MSDKESVLRKIKHCLALSKSANETESATALRQAHAMMSKYGISMDDIALDDIKKSRQTHQPANSQYYINLIWLELLPQSLAVNFTLIAKLMAGTTTELNISIYGYS